MATAGHTVSIRADFLADLREELVSELSKQGFPVGANDDVVTLLVRHLNVAHRRIPAKPRRVFWSKELRQRAPHLATAFRDALYRIEKASKDGEDLTPYLSRKVVGV